MHMPFDPQSAKDYHGCELDEVHDCVRTVYMECYRCGKAACEEGLTLVRGAARLFRCDQCLDSHLTPPGCFDYLAGVQTVTPAGWLQGRRLINHAMVSIWESQPYYVAKQSIGLLESCVALIDKEVRPDPVAVPVTEVE